MKVLIVSSNFPDRYYQALAPWSKKQADSLKTYSTIDLEVVAPRPYLLPIKWIPYHDFTKLPLKETSELGYLIHYPRFPYLVPKKLFYSMTGDLYSFFVSQYMLDHIKKPDIIHARFPYLDGYGTLKACDKWTGNLVCDNHGLAGFGAHYTSPLIGRKQRKTLSYAKKILCVAQWQVKKGLELGISKEKLEHIPLGVDINKFKPRDKEKIRAELGVTESKIVLFVGYLTKPKGVQYLLEAISNIVSQGTHGKDTRFVFIGDGPERTNFVKLSHTLDIDSVVTFTGTVVGTTLLKWYALADVFVLPSLYEGRPTVINEAMASECAIVASNVGGIPEQVRDGYNGFLVEPKTPSALAKKILYLLNNEDELKRMGRNSRKRIIENGWTWEGYAKKVIAVYNELL